MRRTYNKENPEEFEVIREPAHIKAVTEKLQAGLGGYFAKLLKKAPVLEMAQTLGSRFKVTVVDNDAMSTVKSYFEGAVERFEKDRVPYVKLFQSSHMESYRENPSHFRVKLASKCPVIHKTLHSDAEELHEWKMRFAKTDSQELADIFANLIGFADAYVESTDRQDFAKYDKLSAFTFSDIDDDEDYQIPGVIGMGIKSAVLYHLEPALFPRRSRYDLYALYFLTGQETFGMPSDTSEFLMINDHIHVGSKNLKVEHNFWYPYDLFSLYEIRIFRWLKTECSRHGVSLDPDYRYVYVAAFNDHICDMESESVRVMMGAGQDDGTEFYI